MYFVVVSLYIEHKKEATHGWQTKSKETEGTGLFSDNLRHLFEHNMRLMIYTSNA